MKTPFPSDLNVLVRLLEAGSTNRPGGNLRAKYITVHNTGNRSVGADALRHARYLEGEAARARKVSWHFTVDGQRIVQHLPIDEVGWHAGSRKGNAQSLGIEICMNADGDEAGANQRAARLIAFLLDALGLATSAVVPHRFWSGKRCPERLLAPDRWQAFLSEVARHRSSPA